MGSPSFYLSPKGFVNAGHRMILVMPRGDERPGPGDYRGIELHRYGGGPHSIRENPNRSILIRTVVRQAVYWRYVWASYRAGVEVCRRERPDALIAYGDYSVPAAYLLSKRFGLPLVTRLFGTNLARYLGHPLWLLYHYTHVLPYKLRGDYLIMCNDGSEGDRVATSLGVDPERLRFWRNGGSHDGYEPDTDREALRERLGLPAHAPLLFTISRIHPEKHVDRIIEALPAVRERHPTARFVVIGEGPEEPRLRRQIERLGVRDAVIWAGAVPRQKLADYINACDLFVAMSDRTNAANPLFESMLCGRAGVVLDTGDTARVVHDGENGWLVAPDRVDALGDRLAGILDDPADLERVGRAAREWAVANIPTYEARQRMEVELVEQAVRDHAVAPRQGSRS